MLVACREISGRPGIRGGQAPDHRPGAAGLARRVSGGDGQPGANLCGGDRHRAPWRGVASQRQHARDDRSRCPRLAASSGTGAGGCDRRSRGAPGCRCDLCRLGTRPAGVTYRWAGRNGAPRDGRSDRLRRPAGAGRRRTAGPDSGTQLGSAAQRGGQRCGSVSDGTDTEKRTAGSPGTDRRRDGPRMRVGCRVQIGCRIRGHPRRRGADRMRGSGRQRRPVGGWLSDHPPDRP